MMKLLTVIAALVVLVAAFFMFAPEDRVHSVTVKWKRLTGDAGQQCFDTLSQDLKDPTSAQIVSSAVRDNRVFVTYRAVNSFGAYVQGSIDCPLKRGHIDKVQMAHEYVNSLTK